MTEPQKWPVDPTNMLSTQYFRPNYCSCRQPNLWSVCFFAESIGSWTELWLSKTTTIIAASHYKFCKEATSSLFLTYGKIKCWQPVVCIQIIKKDKFRMIYNFPWFQCYGELLTVIQVKNALLQFFSKSECRLNSETDNNCQKDANIIPQVRSQNH